jgi:hypothetical protein
MDASFARGVRTRDAWRKFTEINVTETRAQGLRARYALILPRPRIQYTLSDVA